MSDVDRAIREIADIRAQMAMSTRFRGYAPGVVGVIGLAALALLAMQIAWPARFAADDRQFVLLWGLLMAAGFLVIGTEAIVRAHRENGRMAHPMLAAAMRVVVPTGMISAAVPLVVLAYAPDAAWIVPGIWQMLIGLVAFASYPSMPRSIVWPGAWFQGSGAAGLIMAGQHGALTPLLVGVPFAIGHLGIALSLAEAEGSVGNGG